MIASREASQTNLPAVGTRFIGRDGSILEFVEVNATNRMYAKEEVWSCWTMNVVGFIPGSKGATDGFASYRIGKTACMDPRTLTAQ